MFRQCPIKIYKFTVAISTTELKYVLEILESTNHADSKNDDGGEHYEKAHVKWLAPFMICLSTFFLAKGITYAFIRHGYKKRAEQIHILGLLNLIFN